MLLLKLLAVAFTAACASDNATSQMFVPMEDVGLKGYSNYPGPDDVCMVVGESDLTRKYLDDSETLIGCPVHEKGAIENRLSERGQLITEVNGWVLISMPIR